jgi:hypothetical protein
MSTLRAYSGLGHPAKASNDTIPKAKTPFFHQFKDIPVPS